MVRGRGAITLFDGGEDGYGWAVKPQGGKTYHWAINFDFISGRAVPANLPARLSLVTLDIGNEFTAAFEWEDANGQPLVVAACGDGSSTAKLVFLKNSGATTNNQTQDPYLGGVLYRYDQDATADPDEEMAFFCNGADNDVLIRRKKDGTVDGGATVTHTAKADGLAVVGGDLWRWKGYKIAKCTTDADPGLETSYPTEIPVGRPTYPINAVLPLGSSPIVLKGDGVFKYNPAPSVAEFISLTPFITPHPDNGKGGFTDGRGRIYYPTVDGDLLVLTFGFQSQQRPSRISTINRDTPWGRLGPGTADGDSVYVAVQPGPMRTEQIGLTVFSDDGGSFTNHTTNVTDGSYNTNADWTALTSGGSDFIYVGADEPFLGIYMELDTASGRTTAVSAPLNIEYGRSGGWTAIDPAAGVAGHDGTRTFAEDGLICLTNSNADDLTQLSSNPWIKTTVNSSEKYWVRLYPNETLTGVKMREVRVVPYRPPLDKDVHPITAYKLGGCLPTILRGTWRGEQLIWHDVWTVRAPRIEQLLITRTNLIGSPPLPGTRALVAITGEAALAMPVGTDAHPARAPWPLHGSSTGQSFPMDEYVLALSGNTFEDAGEEVATAVKRASEVQVEVPFTQEDDEWWFYWWWDDDTDRVYRDGPFAQRAFTVKDLRGEGRTLYTALALKDGSRDAVVPYLERVQVTDWEWDDVRGETQATRITSPQSH